MPLKTALQMHNIVKRYRKRYALKNLNLEIKPGETTGLIGSNGAGKTTALSIAAGITRPTSGYVNVLELGEFDPMRSSGRVSFLPQDTWLPRHCVVLEQLLFYAKLQGMEPGDAESCAKETLNRVNLIDRQYSRIGTLSHGMRRRLHIAQAFMGNPELILLDEPLSGLDPREVVNIRAILSECAGTQTVLISSHNLAEIQRICDHVAFIEKGQLIRKDSMDGVTGKTQSITYLLGCNKEPLEELRKALPKATFKIAEIEKNDKEKIIVQCDFQSGISPAAINEAALKCLLSAGVEIYEVSMGYQLEQAYLNPH